MKQILIIRFSIFKPIKSKYVETEYGNLLSDFMD